jgi:hypothetical protein
MAKSVHGDDDGGKPAVEGRAMVARNIAACKRRRLKKRQR